MIESIRKIPSPEELKNEYPLPVAVDVFRRNAVSQIRDILAGKDKRKLFIVGPCSADDPAAVIEYAGMLKRVADEVKDKLFTVMRVYTAKPRTRGGYLGLLFTPEVDTANTDLCGGIKAVRDIHLRIAKEIGLCTADELLYTDFLPYIDDIVSYLSVGARTCDDPLHRFVASGAEVPVGIKNPLNGNLEDLIYSVKSAKTPNEFMYRGMHVRAEGNRFAHAVLRGAVDADGNHVNNCGRKDIEKYNALCKTLHTENALIVDAGHSNSGKRAKIQCDVIDSVLSIAKNCPDIDNCVKGFIVESYIESGYGTKHGQSVTDECLGFEDTKTLMFKVADKIIA